MYEENQRLRTELMHEREGKMRAQHALLELKDLNNELTGRLEEEVIVPWRCVLVLFHAMMCWNGGR